MTREEVLAKVKGVTQEKVQGITIRDEDLGSSYQELGVDSLDLIEISMALDDEYEIKIPQGDLDVLIRGSITGMADYVMDKIQST